MGKRLPYFQFEPAEWLAGDIAFCSLEAQGLFVNLCVVYWQRDCELNKDQFLKRFNNEKLLNELVSEGVILIDNGKIEVKFLKNQFEIYNNKALVNQENGKKGGRPKKPTETQNKPNGFDSVNPNETQDEPKQKPLREDKIIEDEIREKIINNNAFVVECKNSDQWIEAVAMQNRIRLDGINFFLDHFENHLVAMQEQKHNSKEFKEHFSHWLRKQDLSLFSVKIMGRTNQI